MFGKLGFSYIGAIFLLFLFIPNLIWTKNKPQGYDNTEENKILLALERIGQILVSCTVLIFSNFNFQKWSKWTWWLIAAAIFMVLYECWWIRYFHSKKTAADFYSSFFGIPVAGAALPVIAFFLLGIYGKVPLLILSTLILGIGHIGIHLNYYKNMK